MVKDSDNNDDKKLEFDPTGQAVAYISLDQARVLALQHARDNRDFYGRGYTRRDLVWDVVGAEETEDYYEVKLSYRPARGFRGQPGLEQFTIDKAGPIEFRQILDEPVEQGRVRRRSIRAALILVVVLVAATGATIVFGGPGGGDRSPPLESQLLASPERLPGLGVPQGPVAPAVVVPAPPILTPLPPQPLVIDQVDSNGECNSLADASAKVQRALAITSASASPLPIEITQLADQAQAAMSRGDYGAACQSLDELLILLGKSTDNIAPQPEPTPGFTGKPEPTIATAPKEAASPTPTTIPTANLTLNPTAPAPTPVLSPEPANRTGGMVLGATISGRVTDAVSGRPLSNVEIRGDNVLRDAPGGNARTGDEGRYTLRGLAPGTYRIWAEAPDESYIEQYYNNRRGWDGADFVDLNTAAAVEDINFALETGGTISGRVSDKLTGLPIEGVRVRSQSTTDGADSNATTDAFGSYTLRGLVPGSHRVWAQTERQLYIQTYYGDVTRWDDANLVFVSGKSEVKDIDLSLEKGSTISEKVVDAETGQPITGLNIRARQIHGDDTAYGDTDFNGAYTLWGVPEGIQEIIVSGSGYIEERRGLEIDGRSQILDFDFNLILGGSVSGTVTDGDTRLPLPNMDVHAEIIGDGSHVAWETTDAKGRFILRGLAPGDIRVIVEGHGYIPRELSVSVFGQETVTGVNLELDTGGTISGKVTDEATGFPIVGATVRGNWDEEGYESETRTDGQGRYLLTGLGEGHHRLWVQFEDQSYIPEFYNNTLDWDRAELVLVQGREVVGNIDFSLALGATISGKVADGLTGRPIAGMDVKACLDNNDISYASTNSAGNYFLRGVPDGLVEVIVRGRGYIEQRRDVRVSDGQDVTGVDF